MNIEDYLKNAFDYQRFANDPALAKLIAETEERCSNAIPDDDMESVSAAGDISVIDKARKENKNG